jgi:elongation factor G
MKHVGKSVLVRALGDGVRDSSKMGGVSIGSLNAIDVKTPLSHLAPGEFALTIKSDHVAPGKFYTPEKAIDLPEWTDAHPPALNQLVAPVHEKDDNKLSNALARLADIDRGLAVTQDETSGRLEIGVQGPLHLRRIVGKLAEAFGIDVECSEVPTAYREAICKPVEKRYRHRKQSGGAGQFAEVVIAIAPGARGSGFEFNETVKGGAIPKNYIPSVEAGAREALAAGPSGYPVVDIFVTLKDGKTHSVDSSDFAFRTAGKIAVKEAVIESGTIILQPILKLEANVPSVFAGGLVQLASSMKGQVLGFEAHPTASGWDVFHALLPMASCQEFSRALGGATRGTAWFVRELDHYEETREHIAANA